MPGLVLQAKAGCQCAHAAPAKITPAQSRVLVSGQPVVTMASQITVTGCPFQAGTKPQPCVTIRWSMASLRVLVGGVPAMLLPAPGPGPAVCLSAEQLPQGPPMLSAVQPRVIAT